MEENPMVGLWKLVSYIVRLSDGTENYPLGKDAVGFIYYGCDGFVSGIMMERSRPHFETGNRLGARADEKLRAWDSAITYMGTYDFNGDHVVHQIKASVFPDWTGDNQLRHRTVKDNGDVELTACIEERGVRRDAIATWRRIPVSEMQAA